jgi:hypothetical protein
MDGGNSLQGTAVIGDVSGNVITFGSEYIFNTGGTSETSVAALSPTKFVVAYRDSGNSDRGTAAIGDVSGSVIGFGSEYIFSWGTTLMEKQNACALSDTKFVVAYGDGNDSYHGKLEVGEVSGNSISYGSAYEFNSAYSNETATVALSNANFLVAYTDGGSSDYGMVRVGEVSDDDISLSPEFVFNNAAAELISLAAVSDCQFVVAFGDADNNSYGTTIVGKVAGNAITFGSESVFNNASIDYNMCVVVLSRSRFAVAYSDTGNSYSGTAIVAETATLLGIADDAASSGQSVPVIIHGVSDNHSSLTPGAFYYAQQDGSITPNWTSTQVGLAISSTELLLDIQR